jgi:hypothetical protein
LMLRFGTDVKTLCGDMLRRLENRRLDTMSFLL